MLRDMGFSEISDKSDKTPAQLSEKYRAVTMSADDSEPPGWPDCASKIIVSAVFLSSFAFSLSILTFSFICILLA